MGIIHIHDLLKAKSHERSGLRPRDKVNATDGKKGPKQ